MAEQIDNITDAFDQSITGKMGIKVFIAEQVDVKTFTVADQATKTTLIIENSSILEKRICHVGFFVKLINPIVSDDRKSLIMTENSMMFPMRGKKDGFQYKGSPAPFKPHYDPNDSKEEKSSHVDSGILDTIHKQRDYGSFEIECFRKSGDVSYNNIIIIYTILQQYF